MGSKPLIYCCVPREGIMTMTFWYGIAHWYVFLFLGVLFSLSDAQFEWLRKFVDPDDELEDTIYDYLELMARFVLGYVYFYTCYLSYKRHFKPISNLLYYFAADIIWDAWCLLMAFQEEFKSTMKKSKITINEVPEDKEKFEVIVEAPIRYVSLIWLMICYVIPLINKIYVIMKIRAYAKYVEYKKEEAESCSKTTDLH